MPTASRILHLLVRLQIHAVYIRNVPDFHSVGSDVAIRKVGKRQGGLSGTEITVARRDAWDLRDLRGEEGDDATEGGSCDAEGAAGMSLLLKRLYFGCVIASLTIPFISWRVRDELGQILRSSNDMDERRPDVVRT